MPISSQKKESLLCMLRKTSNEKGSGLGLIFTKDFIDILGGSIKVESTLNKGTCVYIYF
jgi:signal transduction histidine kinase